MAESSSYRMVEYVGKRRGQAEYFIDDIDRQLLKHGLDALREAYEYEIQVADGRILTGTSTDERLDKDKIARRRRHIRRIDNLYSMFSIPKK